MTRNYKIYERNAGFFSSLSVTFILILINIMAFIFFLVLLSSETISLDFVAIKPSNILQGNYLWTFITSMFMHAGFFHLLVNMLSLLFIGSFIERILGKRRYFWFYIASGLFAGLFFVLSSMIFVGDIDTFAVGASGALFGIAGLMVILTPNMPLYLMFIPIPIKAKYAIPGMLAVLWLISVTAGIPIGNTAHLGGLLAGVVYGIYLKNKYRRKTEYISRSFR